ncbi:MAG: hypothetical protein WBL44_12540 [Nitrososphaeraceae archaeon]|jgi:hypothetical protein
MSTNVSESLLASIILSAFLSLCKPIGRVMLEFAFMNIVKIARNEMNILPTS